jgi:hypothetical protein
MNSDYEYGELFKNIPGFSNGLSVTTAPFGVRVISEVISQDTNGNFTQTGNRHKTYKTITVLRAVARWITDRGESSKKTENIISFF